MRKARLLAIAGVVALAIGMSALPVQAAGNRVKIVNFQFKPANKAVSVGTKVVWKNTATMTTHSVTAYGGGWSKNTTVAPGTSTHFTFSTPGTYTYYCRFHASIVGGVCTPDPGRGHMCGTVSVT